jgi:rubrerythrin
VPPLILGLILGPLAEGYFRTAMGMHGNDVTVFFTRPISAVLLLASLLCLAWPARQAWVNRRRAAVIRRALPALDLLVRLEGSSQRLYAGFAERFRNRPELAAFWQRLAEDEGRHLQILAVCRDMVREKPPFQSRLVHVRGGSAPDANWRTGEISRLLQRVEDGIEKSRSGPLSLDEAFEIALSLERSEVQQLYDSCLALPPQPFADVIANLASAAEGDHLEKFASVIQAFSSDRRLLDGAMQLKAQQEKHSVSARERLEASNAVR